MIPAYDAGGVTLYHGRWEDVLPEIGTVDHVITDPPYSEEVHSYHDSGRDRGAATAPSVRAALTFDGISQEYLRIFLRALAVRRWTIFTIDHFMLPAVIPPPGPLSLIRLGAWVKRGATPQFSGDRPSQGWEPVVILHSREGSRVRWNGGGAPATWETVREANRWHPTQKPLSLLQRWVADFSDPGELILDPFVGSGTTVVAARNLGRRAIGIDVDDVAIARTIERLAQAPLLIPEAEPASQEALL